MQVNAKYPRTTLKQQANNTLYCGGCHHPVICGSALDEVQHWRSSTGAHLLGDQVEPPHVQVLARVLPDGRHVGPSTKGRDGATLQRPARTDLA